MRLCCLDKRGSRLVQSLLDDLCAGVFHLSLVLFWHVENAYHDSQTRFLDSVVLDILDLEDVDNLGI